MEYICGDSRIVYKNELIDLFYDDYNCGLSTDIRTTERSVELAIAKVWLMDKERVVEIGAVSPYYSLVYNGKIVDIIDPADEHASVSIKDSLFNVSLVGRDVLSISTIEHVGTGDYDNPVGEDPIDALRKIVAESKSCLVTFPTGYNKQLDEYIGRYYNELAQEYNLSIELYFRNKQRNDWRVTKNIGVIDCFDYGPLWANAVVVIEKTDTTFINRLITSNSSNMYERELEYLNYTGSLSMYPYFWRHEYLHLDVEVFTDIVSNMHFVMRKGKKLYFPKDKSPAEVQKIYNWLLFEDDRKSPHKYTTDTFNITKGSVLIDVGAAEGFFALDHIDEVNYAYIFETDPNWIAALEQTFASYKDKVSIINKFAADNDQNNNIRIDSAVAYSGRDIFIKIDTEGAEHQVLDGMQGLMATNKIKLAICTYHKASDAEYFEKYFADKEYKTQFTNGYLIVPFWDEGKAVFGEPSFRKGVIRCWQTRHYSVEDDKTDVYEHETFYKLIEQINAKRLLIYTENGQMQKQILNKNEELSNKNEELSNKNEELSNKNEELSNIKQQLNATKNDVSRQRRHKKRYKIGLIALILIVAFVYVYISIL